MEEPLGGNHIRRGVYSNLIKAEKELDKINNRD